MPERQVTVGDRQYTIPRFRGLKGEIAGVILKKVTSEAREVIKTVGDFEREWHEENKIRVTREFCAGKIADFKAAVRQAEQLAETAPEEVPEVVEGQETRLKTKAEHEQDARLFAAHAESWEQQQAELGDKPFIELPNNDGPDTGELILAGFEKAFDLARAEVKQLMALVVISNADLKDAYEAGDEAVEEKLRVLGNELFYEGDIPELLELAVAAGETLEAEMARYRAPLDKLQALYARARGRTTSKSQTRPQQTQETASTTESGSDSETSSQSESPTESTSSAPTTGDGDETTSSSELVGASSSPSATE